MLTTRVTAKVASRLKTPLNRSPPPSTGRLGDWYANLLIFRRQHLLLLVSERTLLPMLMPAKHLNSFPERLPAVLKAMLTAIGIPEVKIDQELAGMSEWTLAKTASRQILGSMNDFANMLDAYLADGAPLERQAMRLAVCPCSPLGMNRPIVATAEIFGEQVSRDLDTSALWLK